MLTHMDGTVSNAGATGRAWLATGAVAAVMVGILAVGWILAKGPVSLPSGPISVARGVAVTPPDGWQVGGRSAATGTVLFSRGDTSLAVSVVDGSDEVAALASRRDEWLAEETVSAGEILQVSVRPGQPAARFAYSGTFEHINSPVEGSLTAVRGTQLVVLFDGWAGFGEYASVATDIDPIIRAAVIP